jgi:hypothetical protein
MKLTKPQHNALVLAQDSGGALEIGGSHCQRKTRNYPEGVRLDVVKRLIDFGLLLPKKLMIEDQHASIPAYTANWHIYRLSEKGKKYLKGDLK